MWRIWQMVEPIKILTGLYVFLGILAFLIHFILLSTERYNWIENPKKHAEVVVPAPLSLDALIKAA